MNEAVFNFIKNAPKPVPLRTTATNSEHCTEEYTAEEVKKCINYL